jgi:hypothetical protein
LPKHAGVNLEYINKIHWLLDAFFWSFTKIGLLYLQIASLDTLHLFFNLHFSVLLLKWIAMATHFEFQVSFFGGTGNYVIGGYYLKLLFVSLAVQPRAGYGLLVLRGSLITHNDAPQSVELLWTSDQLVAETST